MKHIGDITKLSGYTLPVVDVITGGSPCQDLSVAGKRAGLAGERSGLFMEQIRIVREMRERDVRDNGRSAFMVRPRYMVWENVQGAFSSGKPKGADFAAVIEEIIKVAESDANVCVCVPDGGWSKSGCYYSADGRWSIAWRLHDAQFWGVPQRRKRIALVADFGGLSAPEILFERKGLSGDFESGEQTREETAGSVGCGIESTEPIPIHDQATRFKGKHGDKADGKGNGLGIGNADDPANTLSSADRHAVLAFKQGQGSKAGGIGAQEECSPTLSAAASGTNQVPAVYDARGNGDGKTVCTLTGDHEDRVTDYTALCVGNGQLNQMSMAEQANTLDTMHDQQAVLVAGALTPWDGQAQRVYPADGIMPTLQAREKSGMNRQAVLCGIVRRLTPLECERLQGYPDGWTDIGDWEDRNGKKHKAADSPRYKALGNSIALPFWFWLLRRISAQYERPATLGSLFDGIGGFPLCWERCNGPGTAIWASEIEEFAIAVTKKRFPEDQGKC